jgi:hypothetical protein
VSARCVPPPPQQQCRRIVPLTRITNQQCTQTTPPTQTHDNNHAKGIVDGCRQSGCSLLGGETAEMPGFYQPGEYDLAGFAVGAVKQDAVIDGKAIAAGDVVLGMKSSGVHSNGFSLVRKVGGCFCVVVFMLCCCCVVVVLLVMCAQRS